MSTPNERQRYIRTNYSLTQAPDGTWVARCPYSTIKGADRAAVVRKARCEWGHFNFDDEAEAFAEIFPPGVR